MFDLLFSPYVMAQRWPLLLREAFDPVPSRRSETMLAMTEKVVAMQIGLFHAHQELMLSMVRTSASIMSGRSPIGPMAATGPRMAQAALRPAAKRVKANMRRLSRKTAG